MELLVILTELRLPSWKLTESRYTYAILVSAEISAAATVIQYWTTAVPVAVWITIILVLVVFLNIFVVSVYGESEFWFARWVQIK